jgi:hypothetical protein
MTELAVGDLDRSVIFDPGETVDVLRQLLDLTSIHLTWVRPNPPSILVPLASLWHSREEVLEVLFANNATGDGSRIIYQMQRTTHAELRPVEVSPVPDLAAAIDELKTRSPAGCWWVRLDENPTYWHYDQGDWAYQVQTTRKDLVETKRREWRRAHWKGNPPPVVSWMDKTVEQLNAADQT